MQFFQNISRRHVELAVVGLLVLVCAAVWLGVYAATPSGVLTFAVMDVGQGDSLYIESPTGVRVVVDGGPNNSLLRELPTLMPPLDQQLDAVIETHPDADHIAGFIDLLKRYKIKYFIEPGIEKDTLTAQTLEQEITDYKIPRVLARRGMWLDLGGGAQLQILYPDWDVTHIDQKKDNDGGIVAHLVYGKTSVLLTADTSTAVEDHLLQLEKSLPTSELKSDILKVGHHGSRFSSEDAYVSAVNPSVAIISVGAKNTYGHPTKQTLDTLVKHNIKILRTDQKGTVICKSNGQVFTCN